MSNMEVGKAGLPLCKVSTGARIEPEDCEDSFSVAQDEEIGSSTERRLPESWTEVIEDPKLWKELRTILVESD